MALDLKLPKLEAAKEVVAVEDNVQTEDLFPYKQPDYDMKKLSEAQIERNLEIGRSLLPAHKWVPPHPLSFPAPVEFFDTSRKWKGDSIIFNNVLAPLGKAINDAALKKVGYYPEGYKPEIHGAYVPYRFYGKVDTPFLDTQIKSLGAWIGRKNIGPVSAVNLLRRGVLKYHNSWFMSKRFTGCGLMHMYLLYVGTYYYTSYSSKKENMHAKYH